MVSGDNFKKMFDDYASIFGGISLDSTNIEMLYKQIALRYLRQLHDIAGEALDNFERLQTKVEGEDLNPFDILGVSPEATKEDVDKAYRKKAKTQHPDKGGSHEEMIKVNAAYEAIYMFKGWKKQ